MKIKVILHIVILSICIINAEEEDKKVSTENNEGTKKRGTHELSYSFAATDINSPKGLHIKTITVIKNLGVKKENETKVAKLNPELFKGEWGSKFRDNFDSYGKIPDFPNIDHYFKEKDIDQKEEEKAAETDGMENNMEEDNAQDERKEIPIYENEENQKMEAEKNDDKDNGKDNGKENAKENGKDKKSEELPEDVELVKVDNPKSESKSESLVYVNPKQYFQKYPKEPEIVKVYPQHYRTPPFYASERPNFPYLTPISYKSSYLPPPVLSPTIFLPVQNTTKKSTFIALSESSRAISKPPYLAPNNFKHKTILNNGNQVTSAKFATSSPPTPYIAPNVRKDKLNPSKAAQAEARFGGFPLRLDNALVKISSSSQSTTQRSRGLRYR